MNFRPELAEKVMAGRKTVTRRLASENPNSPWWIGGCKLRHEHDYAVCPGRGKNAIGRVRIVSVDRESLGYVGEHEAIREGFASEQDFIDAFKAINGSYPLGATVWRIEFEVAA